jgi:hypothetical protein
MEPFHAPISIPMLIALILDTFALFVMIVMMGAGIYKENKLLK